MKKGKKLKRDQLLKPHHTIDKVHRLETLEKGKKLKEDQLLQSHHCIAKVHTDSKL